MVSSTVNCCAFRVGDHPRVADLADDSSGAGAASGDPEHGWNIVIHSDSRKRAYVAHNYTGRLHQRTNEGIKLRSANQYPTIVRLVNHLLFRYLGVINSTLQLNQSLKMSTCELDLDHLQQIGLRLASSCDTRCHATPFYMLNSVTMEYEPYVNKLKDRDFTLLRADIYFSPEQQLNYYGQQVAYDGRIVNDLAPRVSNSRLTIPLHRSEIPSQGMYQPTADRLQRRPDQLPMEYRNHYVLNYDYIQWNF